MPRAKAVNHHYFDELSERSAWMLGFWMADGSITKRYHSYQIAFYQKDRGVLEMIKKELGSEHTICGCTRAYQLQFCSKHMGKTLYDIFRHSDLSEKSCCVEWPKLPDGVFWDFMRGWVDGDGHIRCEYGQHRLTICCGSLPFLSAARDEIEKYTGILCSIKGGGSVNYMSCYGVYAQAIVGLMYHGASLYIERKKEDAEKLIAWIPRERYCHSRKRVSDE